jgi:hypothetical protein
MTTWLTIAILMLVFVLMKIFNITLIYIGTDQKKYDRALFGILLRE